MLTEMVTLEPHEQASRLKEVEKLPLKAENLQRIKKLRSNIESIPTTPKHSVTQYSRFIDSEFSDFALSPEILSEKLFDSVRMIRDLMNSNSKLKDSVKDISIQKKSLELENSQLLNENQDLLEKIENLEHMLSKFRNERNESKEITKVKREREMVMQKIEKLQEEEKRYKEIVEIEKEGKRKGKSGKKEKKGKEGPKLFYESLQERNNFRDEVEKAAVKRKKLRPLSQEFLMDSTKQEAIVTLSKILMKGVVY